MTLVCDLCVEVKVVMNQFRINRADVITVTLSCLHINKIFKNVTISLFTCKQIYVKTGLQVNPFSFRLSQQMQTMTVSTQDSEHREVL
jgi:hypothetical protein